MRNLLVFLVLFIALGVSGQTKLTKGGSFEGLGKQGDTLIASSTVDYILELGNDVYGVLSLAIESDHVSGDAAYECYLYKSLNGRNWGVPIDTLSYDSGGNYYEEFSPINATRTFYKVSTVATSAAQKSKLMVHGRLNEGFVIQE